MTKKNKAIDLVDEACAMIKTELELTEDFFSLLLGNEEMKKKGS